MTRFIVVALLGLAVGPVIGPAALAADNNADRISECTHRASDRHLTGSERKQFVDACIAQSQDVSMRRADCSARADERGLRGDAKRNFVDWCERGDNRYSEVAAGQYTNSYGECSARADQRNLRGDDRDDFIDWC